MYSYTYLSRLVFFPRHLPSRGSGRTGTPFHTYMNNTHSIVEHLVVHESPEVGTCFVHSKTIDAGPHMWV